MPEEKPPVVDNSASDAEAHGPEIPVAGVSAKPVVAPQVILGVVVMVLLGLLLIGIMRRGGGARPSGGDEGELLSELQAEANALRSELNRERMAMGLRPLEGGSEPVGDIAKRLRKDAETMAALAGSFQTMLAEKDGELSAKSAELLRSEQLRHSLASESVRLQGELQRALVSSAEADLLRRDLAAITGQRDTLAAELAALANGVSAADFADLQRRYDEALKAKEFFEARAKQLDGSTAAPPPPVPQP